MIPAMTDADHPATPPRALEEALKRIADCARRRSLMLDLSGLGLRHLPAKISQLGHLAELNLSHNGLLEWPREITALTGLTRLHLGANSLRHLPDEIGIHTNLTVLDVSGNPLESLPAAIGALRRLTRLDLSHTRVTALPAEVGQLARLTRLYAAHAGLTAVPPELATLGGLTRIYLAGNAVTSLPHNIGQLENLTRLDLSNNQLADLPPELGGLAKLTVLDLSGNLLEQLPSGLAGLGKLTVLSLQDNRLTALPEALADMPQLESLLLHGNPALHLSPLVLGPDPRHDAAPPVSAKSILRFYFSRLAGRTQPLNEAALMLLGPAGAGKSSVARALRDQPFREHEETTTGVAHADVLLEGGRGGPLTLHVRDFSGDSSASPVHSLWFLPQAVAVVVLYGRGGAETEDAHHWLGMLERDAAQRGVAMPPVIVALNQWLAAGRRPEVDRAALRERHPAIRGFVEMDCRAKKGVAALQAAINRELDRMPRVREPFTDEWRAVRDDLIGGKPCLSLDDYHQLCLARGVNDAGQQQYLVTALHEAGVIIARHEPSPPQAPAIIHPPWLTRLAYAAWHHAQRQAGLLAAPDLERAMPTENDPALRLAAMAVLTNAGLFHAIPEPPGGWLAPAALPAVAVGPVDDFENDAHAARRRFNYTRDPRPLLLRLLAKRHAFIESWRDQPRQWRDGMVLARQGARAWLRVVGGERRIDLTVIGPMKARKEFTRLMRLELHDLSRGEAAEFTEEILVQGQWEPCRFPEQAPPPQT